MQTFRLTLAGCSASAIDVVNDALSGSDCHFQHVEDLSSLARKLPAGEDGLHSMILAFLPRGLDSREIDVHAQILTRLARESRVVAISASNDDAALSVALRAGIPLIPEGSLNAGVVRRLLAELGSMPPPAPDSELWNRHAAYLPEHEHLALDRHAIVSAADEKGIIIHANDRFCEISGYPRNELMGRTHNIVKSGHHSEDFYRDMWNTIAGGQTWKGEICNRRKNGDLYWVECSIVPFLDKGGKPYQYVSIRTDITDLVLAEERLRRGQNFANIGTWEWDVASGMICWSERIPVLFGLPEGNIETSYDKFLKAVHPDDRRNVMGEVNTALESREPYEIEFRVVWPDGTVRWLIGKGAVVADGPEDAVRMIGVVQDVDGRKRIELELSERERQLNEAQSIAQLGNWRFDYKTGEVVWSDETYRLLGHEPQSFLPTFSAFSSHAHPDDRQLTLDGEQEAVRAGSHNFVHRIVRADGSIRHVHQKVQATCDRDGNLAGMKGTVQDVTERVKAEAQLRETEARFAYAVQSAGDAVWDWDIDAKTIKHSGLFAKMLERAEEEIPTNVDELLANIHPDDLPRIRQLATEFINGEREEIDQEFRIICGDGQFKWFHCRGRAVTRDENGKPKRLLGVVTDIDERKRTERALVETMEEAERANRAKTEFFSSISHELRTPLNAILGFGQLVAADEALPATHRDSVGEIVAAGRHLLNLINEVLDLAKVESGRVTLSLESIPVNRVLQECIGLVRPLAQQRGITIKLHGVENLCVRADKTRFKQILLNLLSNAIKYNRADGNVYVLVRVIDAFRARISIEDTGHGIPQNQLPQLFQPFNRLGAEDSSVEGTGIGLALTQRLAQMMNGALGVASTMEKGSTFWLDLPIGIDGGKLMPKTRSASTTLSVDLEAKKNVYTVLYVDDNPSNLKLMSQVFSNRQHIKLVSAQSAKHGLDLMLSEIPDIVLLDINMPDINGYEFIRIVRQRHPAKNVPVVAVTANTQAGDSPGPMTSGFDDYLAKPLDPTQLIQTVETWLLNDRESA